MVRAAGRAAMTGMDPSRFVFLEETSTPITLTPPRARAPRGQRAGGSVPRGQRPHIAWLATRTPRGLGESLLVKGTIDQRVFFTFVERVLVPSLRPGQIVLLDTLAVHKSAQARARSEAAGCHRVFLPPYAPDFNPIEPAFAKIKQALRRRGARSWDTVVATVADVLPTITAAAAQAVFADAGFPLIVQ